MTETGEQPRADFIRLLCRFRHAAAAVVLVGASLYFFLMPGFLVARDLMDPALRSGERPSGGTFLK